jgi:hypothetical protein
MQKHNERLLEILRILIQITIFQSRLCSASNTQHLSSRSARNIVSQDKGQLNVIRLKIFDKANSPMY